ncbi:MAG: hypothetical protein D6759_12640 [Chloroflexi bacterium]|nr:MAG: hypothetical protein D6759_12640 [Chloroflexota bacterium]
MHKLSFPAQRVAWVFIITILGLALTAAATAWASRPGATPLLSAQSEGDAAFPAMDSVTVGSGTYEVIVWSEGQTTDIYEGNVYLKWMRLDEGVWRTVTLAGGTDYYGSKPAVVLQPVDPPIAHVVWVEAEKVGAQIAPQRIEYCRATLTTALTGCDAGTKTTAAYQNGDPLVDPDIALDSQGRAHVVWVRVQEPASDIYYTYDIGSSGSPQWPLPELVPAPSASPGNYATNFHPAIAASGDTVHVVWVWQENDTSTGKDIDHEVQYARREGSSWSTHFSLYDAGQLYQVFTPDVVARGSLLFAAWARASVYSSGDYNLLLKWTDIGGGNSNLDWSSTQGITQTTSIYYSVGLSGEDPDYTEYLRPSLRLSTTSTRTVVYVVWQAQQFANVWSPYKLLYSRGITASALPAGTMSWTPVEFLVDRDGSAAQPTFALFGSGVTNSSTGGQLSPGAFTGTYLDLAYQYKESSSSSWTLGYETTQPWLKVSPTSVYRVVPITNPIASGTISVGQSSKTSFNWTASVVQGPPTVTVTVTSSGSSNGWLNYTLEGPAAVGTYYAKVRVDGGTETRDSPQEVVFTLKVWERVYDVYLPITLRNGP